jgi:dTMP kinase
MELRGLLIAFEGLDQSGKQTQTERLRDRLIETGREVRLLSFPAYDTPIGVEIRRALEGGREWGADVMQLLYIANRYEVKPLIERELARGVILVCDRYVASSLAYGETQGLDASWLRDVQRYLPKPDLTFLLDIAPAVSARRKTSDRDKFERDLALLARVRENYLRQAADGGWVRLDADRDRDVVASEVFAAVKPLL